MKENRRDTEDTTSILRVLRVSVVIATVVIATQEVAPKTRFNFPLLNPSRSNVT